MKKKKEKKERLMYFNGGKRHDLKGIFINANWYHGEWEVGIIRAGAAQLFYLFFSVINKLEIIQRLR